MEFRKSLAYPPFTRIALLTLKGMNEEKVQFTAEHLRRQLEPLVQATPDIVVVGPAPAALARAEGFYRYTIMLRTTKMAQFSRKLGAFLATVSFPDGVTVSLDIDPANFS